MKLALWVLLAITVRYLESGVYLVDKYHVS